MLQLVAEHIQSEDFSLENLVLITSLLLPAVKPSKVMELSSVRHIFSSNCEHAMEDHCHHEPLSTLSSCSICGGTCCLSEDFVCLKFAGNS